MCAAPTTRQDRASTASRIFTFGSLNIDLVQQVPRLPIRGETMKGGALQIFCGGKGANQACAAALLGGRVVMAGQVGKDAFGVRLRSELTRTGVDVSLVEISDTPTGSATIFILPDGENVIVIAAGANANNSVPFAIRAVDNLSADDFLLCQLEIPLEAVQAALQAAATKGATTILDPAPASELSRDLLALVSILTPNQSEARFLLKSDMPLDTPEQAVHAAKQLQSCGVRTVILKLGKQGCLVAEGEQHTLVPGFEVNAMDTTAAGDVFNGALAVGLGKGMSLLDAARFANAAAALSVTKPGAIASMPCGHEVDQFLRSRS